VPTRDREQMHCSNCPRAVHDNSYSCTRILWPDRPRRGATHDDQERRSGRSEYTPAARRTRLAGGRAPLQLLPPWLRLLPTAAACVYSRPSAEGGTRPLCACIGVRANGVAAADGVSPGSCFCGTRRVVRSSCARPTASTSASPCIAGGGGGSGRNSGVQGLARCI
jgi:hypothetical protein